MPFPGLRSRPSTSASHRTQGSKQDGSVGDVTSPAKNGHSRIHSLKRLSLSHSNDGPFEPFMTEEPERIPQEHGLGQEDQKSDNVGGKSASTPVASSRRMLDDEGTQEIEPKIEDQTILRPQRFSLLGFRHASDPQLSARYKTSAPIEEMPPPTIITTAPTSHESEEPMKRRTRNKLFGYTSNALKRGLSPIRNPVSPIAESNEHFVQRAIASTSNLGREHISFAEQQRPSANRGPIPPPAYGDETNSSLAIPLSRLSDSSRSDGSSGDHGVYAQTTTTHTISTTTTFFKLKRRQKDKGPLFPLPERFPTPASGRSSTSRIFPDERASRKSISPSRRSNNPVKLDAKASNWSSPAQSPNSSMVALTNAPDGTPGPSVVRKQSVLSTHSGRSTPSVSLAPPRPIPRGRSSTMGSVGRSVEKLVEGVPLAPGSSRTSTSTGGRRSFGDLLALPNRLRQNSQPPPRHGSANTPSTPGSKSNSLQISREAEPVFVYPKREADDTPASYLEKLEAAVPRSVMATALCKTADDFSKTCLRKYMRGFSYFGDSIDMAIRKMLMEVELPKETQQIDRLLAGFADRYYECNPGIFTSVDETSFVAFSILLLHSDTHNKNNKRKMQKSDYVKNTQQEMVQVSSDILECFYDNISYTPFIHFEDEIALNSHRLAAPRLKKSLIRSKSSENLRGQIDPYTLILDHKLDALRPSLKEVINTEDTYSSTGTTGQMNTNDLHHAFLKSAVLQIVSARSRPDAFMTQATISNPAEAQAGLVSIKIAKVGFLWRKDAKKKKAKRPWQEWGAILTDSKLYFFKDVGWVRKLVAQYDHHSKLTGKVGSLIFKPPLTSFEPDAWMSMDDAVALTDSSYKKHKHAITFIKHGGFEEIFLANTDAEMNDWIGKLNYAATFRSAGIRMRGLLGTTYEGRQILRKNSELSTTSVDNSAKDSSATLTKVDPQVAWEISYYRRQLINEKISDYDEKLASTIKELDHLLRNARHLLILLPIQGKTREAIVLAAGRMSAKLKWIRVEFWRVRTHRDILARDLEHEDTGAFPEPFGFNGTPQKTKPAQGLTRSDTDTSNATLQPNITNLTASSTSRRPSQSIIDQIKLPDASTESPQHIRRRKSASTDRPISMNGIANLDDPFVTKNDSTQDSHSLIHKPSISSSQPSRQDHDQAISTTDEVEDQVTKETGDETNVQKEKRPETSDSDRDRLGAISPASEMSRERGTSVRRSLHRTLRDPQIREAHQGVQSPGHRHKRGRESGSSGILPDDSSKSTPSDKEELRRRAGQFILHGKKASVVTMTSDWQFLSNEERIRARSGNHESLNAKDGSEDMNNENAIDDETASNASHTASIEGDGSMTGTSSRKHSATTTGDENFVDAKTGEESEETDENEDEDEE